MNISEKIQTMAHSQVYSYVCLYPLAFLFVFLVVRLFAR